MSRLNIIVFGATGFTGKIVVKELLRLSKYEAFSWGIAGRSQSKLKQVLTSCGINQNFERIETIHADMTDPESIKKMCSKANILINCVGPYRFYGEDVVRECINTSTHHLDLSGEPEFLEKIHLEYNQAARDKDIFVIGSCGFDSAVADLGVIFTRQNCLKELTHIESVLSLNTAGKYCFNYATWESLVHGFGSIKNLGRIRKQLFPTRLKKPSFKPPKKTNMLGYYYDQFLKVYAINFLGSDKSVVERTQLLNQNYYNVKPFYFSPYMTVHGIYNILLIYLYGLVFTLLGKSKLGRYLLLKYYKFFSNGIISKDDDKIENIDQVTFQMRLRGYTSDDKKFKQVITTEVSGPDPSYVSASRIVCYSALVILRESEKMQFRGVLTPGFAFANTSLIERLNNDGINFKILESESVNSPKPNL